MYEPGVQTGKRSSTASPGPSISTLTLSRCVAGRGMATVYRMVGVGMHLPRPGANAPHGRLFVLSVARPSPVDELRAIEFPCSGRTGSPPARGEPVEPRRAARRAYVVALGAMTSRPWPLGSVK